MVANIGYIHTASGRLKCAAIVLVGLTLLLSLLGTVTSEYFKNSDIISGDKVSLWREFYLMASAGVCLILSIVNLFIHLTSVDTYCNPRTPIIDFVYQSCAFLLISTSGVLNVVSAVKIFDIGCTEEIGCQKFSLKVAAGGASLIAALLHAIAAAVVLTNRRDVERDALITEEK